MRVRATMVRVAAFALAAIVAGCAQFGTIRPGEPVTIVVKSWSPSFAAEILAIRNGIIERDVNAGGVVGGIGISAACGPYFPLCLAGGGVSLGMSAGGLAGRVVGLAQTAAAKNFAALESLLATSRASFDLRLAALDEALRSEAGKRWTVVPDSPLVAMEIELGELLVAYDTSDRASLQMSVWLRLKWKRGSGRGNADETRFVHQGPFTAVTVWIDPNERFLDDSLRRAFADIAQQMVGVLAGELSYKVRGLRVVPAKGDGTAAARSREY